MGGRAPAVAFALLLASACAACGSTTSSAPPSNGPHQETPVAAASEFAEPTDCRARIEAATFDSPKTIDRVDECRFTDGGVEAAEAVLAAGGSRDVVWAALWVYDDAGADAVRPYLQNTDPSIRAIAAAITASLGERTALTILGALATDADPLLGSHPQLAIGEYAIGSLERVITAVGVPAAEYDGENLGPAAKAWGAWLEQNAGQLVYEPDSGVWSR